MVDIVERWPEEADDTAAPQEEVGTKNIDWVEVRRHDRVGGKVVSCMSWTRSEPAVAGGRGFAMRNRAAVGRLLVE